MPRMHILFLTHYFPPEGNAPATRVYELTRRWVRDGHEVTVITCAPNVPAGVVYPGYKNKWLQRETIDGVKVVRVWTYMAANRGVVRRILNYLSFMVLGAAAGRREDKPDVVIATSPQFFCGWAGALVARRRRVPFVLDVRDIWPESIVAVGAITRPWIIRLLEKWERRLYARAAHIVTVGEGYREQLGARDVSADRVAIIPNGVDRDTFTPREPSAEMRQKTGLGDVFVCSYVGTIGMACGLDVVIRAAQRLKEKGREDVTFLLVGDGATRDRLEKEAREGGLDNVVFTGRVDKRFIPDILSITDACLIHLRKADLFRSVLPSKIFEAAAMAKPIILGVEGGAARLVEEAGAGVCIEPENDEELAAAVEKLADSRSMRESLGRAGYDRIGPHFDYDQLAAAYLDIVRGAMGRAAAVEAARHSETA